MPVQLGSDKVGSFARYGSTGKKYYYKKDDKEAKERAKAKAEKKGEVTNASNISSLKLSDINADRTILLFDTFYEDTAENIVSELIRLDQENKEDINILINSMGGNVYALWSIIDTMDSLTSNVNTICLGEADSCGAVLLAAGKKRYIGENSRAMIHGASNFAWGKEKDLEESLEILKVENKKLIGRLAERTDQDEDFLEDIMKGDVFLDSQESVAFGLVDAVLLNTEKDLEDMGVKNMLLNSAKDVDSFILNSLKKRITSQKNKSEGEKPVTKNELLAKLQEFGVDVTAIQSENKDLATKLGVLTAEKDSLNAKNETLSAQLDEIKAKSVQDQKEQIINKLIDEKKATQATLEAHKFVASKCTLDELKDYVAKLPVMDIKTTPVGDTQNSANSDNVEREDIKLQAKVKAIMKERGLEDTMPNYLKVLKEID